MTPIESICAAMRGVGMDVYVVHGAPDTKNDVLEMTPYLGFPVTADQGIVGDEQRISVRGRAEMYKVGYDLTWQAYQFLLAAMQNGTAFEGYWIVEILQSPTYIEKDRKNRYLFDFNVRLKKILDF
jgi:hypothetical protein